MSNNRINILSIQFGRICCYITSDNDKTYATIHPGMLGEGFLEVGYSSVNGSASNDMQDSCKIAMQIGIQKYVSQNECKAKCEQTWLLYLLELARSGNDAFNTWLFENQHLFVTE